MRNVLITGAWTEDSSIAVAALKTHSPRDNVFIEGRHPYDVGFVGTPDDNHIILGTDKDMDTFIDVNRITHLIPFGDLGYWALRAEDLKKRKGVQPLVNPYQSYHSTLDLFELYKECRKNGIAIPKIYHNHNEIDSFPLIAKTRDKRQFWVLRSLREVFNQTAGRKDIVLQRYVEGSTYEIDFAYDWSQCRKCLPPHYTLYEIMPPTNAAIRLAKEVQEALGLLFGTIRVILGATNDWFIDAKPYLTANTMMFNPKLLVDLLARLDGGKPMFTNIKPGLRMIRVPAGLILEGGK